MTRSDSSASSASRRGPEGSGLPTLEDVAHAAGVSLATASRVLNGSERKVADSYRERVERAAEQLGYSTNVSAQSIARGSSPVIALLVSDIADPYFGLIASGVARGADEHGLIVTISVTERDPDREARILRALRGQRPKGLILAASRADEASETDTRHEIAEFVRTGGRVVVLGEAGPGTRAIEIDNRAGGEMLGRRMGELGYRRAIALAAGEGVRTSDERLAGFRAGFVAQGGELTRVYHGDFRQESGAEFMAKALHDGVDTGTLVFALSDVVAIGAMSAIRTAGREIGNDIAVCGFDDVPSSRDVSPALTTVHVPLAEVGHEAFRAVVDGDDWAPRELVLTVVERESTPVHQASKESL